MRRVRLAAAEASESDPRFAPEMVCDGAERLFCAIQAAWTQDDRVELARLVARSLMIEWEERLKGFALRGWSNKIELRGRVQVDYVGRRNTSEERGKSVVVRVSSRLRDVVIDGHGNTIHRKSSMADTHHICEYWTLGVSGDGWILVSIEQHHEGLHQLHEPIVPSPWSDTEVLQHEAMLEQVAGSRVENAQIPTIASAGLARDARVSPRAQNVLAAIALVIVGLAGVAYPHSPRPVLFYVVVVTSLGVAVGLIFSSAKGIEKERKNRKKRRTQ